MSERETAPADETAERPEGEPPPPDERPEARTTEPVEEYVPAPYWPRQRPATRLAADGVETAVAGNGDGAGEGLGEINGRRPLVFTPPESPETDEVPRFAAAQTARRPWDRVDEDLAYQPLPQAPAPVSEAEGETPDLEGVAEQGEPATEPKHKHSGVREILETVVLALLIFVGVQGVVQNFRVEGSSMDPSLRDGERLLVNKAIFTQIDMEALSSVIPFIEPGDHPRRYLFRAPQRGDIIVFKYPREPDRDFIKRVMGVPGDRIEVRRGVVFINGKRQREPYITHRANYDYGPEVIPEGQYFVLGDNRSNSSDSHSWGTVPEENIIGLAWVSYWPFEEAGLAPNRDVNVPQE